MRLAGLLADPGAVPGDAASRDVSRDPGSPVGGHASANWRARKGLDQDLLDAIAASPGATGRQLRSTARGTKQHVLAELRRLQEAGVIWRVEDPRDRRHAGYHLAVS